MSLILVAALVSACDASVPLTDEASAPIELTPAEQAEVTATFDDAACVCEAVTLLTQTELTNQFTSRTIDVSSKLLPQGISDTALHDYATRHVSSGGQRRFCSSVSTRSARGTVPRRTLGTDATSACVAEWSSPPLSPTRTNPSGPLCVAEFDYCLANELRLEAQSFVRGPSSGAVKVELERLATERAARAIRGYGVRLNECADRMLSRCSVLAGSTLTPLGSAVGARFIDALQTMSDLAESSYEDRLALSDAVPPPAEALGVLPPDGGVAAGPDDALAYLNAVWNGPTGRNEAVEPFYGSGGPPLLTPTQAYDDPAVGRALRLADLYDLPMPFGSFNSTPGTRSYTRVRVVPLSGADRQTRAMALFNMLDLRLLSARGQIPEFLPGTAPSDLVLGKVTDGRVLFAPEFAALGQARLVRSLARSEYGLAPEHLAAAMDLAFDLFGLMQVDFIGRRVLQESVSGGALAQDFYAIDLRAIGQADSRPVLWRRQEFDSSLPPVPNASVMIYSTARANWYATQLSPDDVGVASVLHQARVMALRLQATTGPFRTMIDPAALPGLSLIGSQWTEFARDQVTATGPSPLPRPRWTLYTRTSDVVAGTGYYLVPLSTATCLVNGAPGGLSACAPLDASLKMGCDVLAANFGNFHDFGYSAISCTLASGYPTVPSAVVRTRPDGLTTRIELIDTISFTRNAVHTLGGTLEEQCLRALARTPLAPAFPLFNSLGFEHGTVPPLENSLTSGGTAGEDSWRQYLGQAEAQTIDATRRIDAARDAELQALLNAVSDDAIIGAAAIQSTYERAELCGDSETCALGRVPSSLLSELPYRDLVEGPTRVVVQTVFDPTPGVDCLAVLALPPAKPSDPSARLAKAKEYVNCLAQVVDLRLRDLAIGDLPEAVVSTLGESGTGDFPDYAGQQRELLIDIFDRLAAIHTEQRNFNVAIAAANARFAALATTLDSPLIAAREVACYLDIVASWVQLGIGIYGVATRPDAHAGDPGGGRRGATARDVRGTSRDAGVALTATANRCSTLDARNSFASSAAAGASASMGSAYMALDAIFAAKEVIEIDVNGLHAIAAAAAASTASVQSAVALASTSALEDLEEWKFQQTAAAQQARESLRSAQVLAYAARRAIEFRTLTNLSERNRNEPFVPAPSTWADELTQLQFATIAPGVSAAPDAIDDYVTQLRGFVEGYPFAQRFAEGTDALTLSLRSYLYETGRREIVAYPAPEPLSSSVWRMLRYTCRDGTIEETPSGFADGAVPCAFAGGVAFAEIDVVVESGVDSPVGRRLAPGGYNHRISALGINLVASQLVDCDVVPVSARLECRGDGNVQYAVEQSRITAATDWDGELRAFGVGRGRIEGARALAAERYLTMPLSAADRALLGPYLRTELAGRPLFSEFRLRLYDRPGLDWTKLDDIQLVIEYVRWEQQR